LVEFRGQCQLKVEPMREPSEKKIMQLSHG
jgi:hypothetical protein